MPTSEREKNQANPTRTTGTTHMATTWSPLNTRGPTRNVNWNGVMEFGIRNSEFIQNLEFERAFQIPNASFLISPFGLHRPAAVIDDAREDEEQVGQAIYVAHEHRVDRRIERHDAALRAAADRPRNVKRRAGGRAAGEDEAAERRQLPFEPIDQTLEPDDVIVADDRLGDASRQLVRGIGKPATSLRAR